MGKIIVLMGKSSTGKDTIYKRLYEDRELNLENIVLYTTRPIRLGEQEGVVNFFTDVSGYQSLSMQGKIIESREYHTFHGLWRYFTVDDGRIKPEENYIMIGTLEAYTKLCEYFGEERLLPVLIELDDGVRLQRGLDRERKQEHPKYEEMCRRYLADSEDFSDEKIEAAGIRRRFVNHELEKCVEEIKSYIMSNIS